MITVECAYAPIEGPAILVSLQVEPGSSVQDVIIASGLLERFDELQTANYQISRFSHSVPLTDQVAEGGRVEITLPLKNDPKSARRARSTST